MDFSVFYDKGKRRKINEDNYLIDDSSIYSLLAVADGMGGHKAGEYASKLAINYLQDYNFDINDNLQKDIENVIRKCNDLILKKSLSQSHLKGMGTTLSMGIIYKDYLYTGHVGDSRIYIFRNQNLKKISTDHTLVQKLLERKEIKKEEAFDHPRKNVLTEVLGYEEQLKIDIRKISLKKNDLLILCTDGLTDMIKESDIEKIIASSNFKPESLSKILGKKALANGGKDNLTVIVGKINNSGMR